MPLHRDIEETEKCVNLLKKEHYVHTMRVGIFSALRNNVNKAVEGGCEVSKDVAEGGKGTELMRNQQTGAGLFRRRRESERALKAMRWCRWLRGAYT